MHSSGLLCCIYSNSCLHVCSRIPIKNISVHQYYYSRVRLLVLPRHCIYCNIHCTFRFFTCAYGNVGFEMSTELTYPSPESTATGLLFAMTQILGVFSTLLTGWLYSVYGPFWSIGSQAFLLGLGTLITAFIPNTLRRQAAFRQHNANLVVEFERVASADNNVKA